MLPLPPVGATLPATILSIHECGGSARVKLHGYETLDTMLVLPEFSMIPTARRYVKRLVQKEKRQGFLNVCVIRAGLDASGKQFVDVHLVREN